MKPRMALILMASLAVAQPVTLTAEEVVSSVEAAREEILLWAPAVTSAGVQQALREAALQRGVLVFVLIDARSAWAPASYAPSLAITGEVKVNLSAGEAEGATLVIDRTIVIEGPLAARSAGPLDHPTRSLSDPALALERVRSFNLAWRKSTPLHITDADIRRLLEAP